MHVAIFTRGLTGPTFLFMKSAGFPKVGECSPASSMHAGEHYAYMGNGEPPSGLGIALQI